MGGQAEPSLSAPKKSPPDETTGGVGGGALPEDLGREPGLAGTCDEREGCVSDLVGGMMLSLRSSPHLPTRRDLLCGMSGRFDALEGIGQLLLELRGETERRVIVVAREYSQGLETEGDGALLLDKISSSREGGLQ